MFKLKEKIKKILEVISKPEMKILPGHLAFFLILSIVPIITLFVVIASKFEVSIDIITEIVNNSFPKDTSILLIPLLTQIDVNFNITVFILLGFLVSSGGLYSVIIAANAIYKYEDSSFIRKRIRSFILTFLIIFLLIFVLFILAFGNNILGVIGQMVDSDLIFQYLYMVYLLLKWPIAFLLILFIVNLIYVLAPDKKIEIKNVFKGSIFTTLSWIIATAIYSYYVDNFANYNVFYGNLSNIIITMIWIYLLSYLFIFGMVLTAVDCEMEKTVTDNEKQNS